MTVDSVIQTIDAQIALYHTRVEKQIKQLMSNVSKCFKYHETRATYAMGQNVCGR